MACCLVDAKIKVANAFEAMKRSEGGRCWLRASENEECRCGPRSVVTAS